MGPVNFFEGHRIGGSYVRLLQNELPHKTSMYVPVT
jgi:hypothetical protein